MTTCATLNSKQLLKACLLPIVLLAYLAITWPALSGPFVFDDFPNLQNLQILKGEMTRTSLGEYLASFIGSPGRPISSLSFLIHDNAWPTDPFYFKYTNVMLHLLNGVLLFGFLRTLVKCTTAVPSSAYWPYLVVAAWIFHPLQLSAQMLVVQRMTLLSATFCFAGLWTYVVLLRKSHTMWSTFAAMASLGIATILAFLCKENGALLPVFALVLNATLLANEIQSKPKSSQRLLFFGCLIPALALIMAIAILSTVPNAFTNRNFNLVERLLTQTHVLADYFKQILIPQLSGSGIYFDDYPITRSLFKPFSTFLLTCAILGSIVFAIIFKKRYTLVSFSILWFFAGHLMESSSLSLELYFEHRNYLPLLGPIAALTALPFFVLRKKVTAFALLATWLLLLSLITGLQSPVWGNSALLTTIWAKERPMSLRANQNLANYYYENGQPQAAFDTLINAYHRGVRFADLPMSALIAKCEQPSIDAPYDLYPLVAQALATSIYSNSALANIQILRESALKGSCPKLLTQDNWLALTDIMLKNPKFLSTAEALIRVERAKLFIHQRDLNKTMLEFERTYDIAPTIELTQKIAEVMLSAGLIDDAETWLNKGLKLRKPWFDEKLGNHKQKSIMLLAAIKNSKMKRQSAQQQTVNKKD